MKRLSFLLFVASPLGALAAGAVIPERLPADRFNDLKKESPFVVATAVAEKGPDLPPWSQNLYIGSVAKFNEGGQEKDWVTVRDRTQPGTLINLFGTDANADGYQLVKLIWSEDPKKTKADIKKGTDLATIEVDQAAYGPGAAPPVPGPGIRPGQGPIGVPIAPGANAIRPPGAQMPQTLGAPRPVQLPQGAPPPPAARPGAQIPRPAGQVSLPQPVSPGMQGTSPATSRQRIRVINNNPGAPQ